MTATTGVDRRSDYVSAVAVALTDLAPDDRAELIEELDDHVAALLEDRPEADLVSELGTPLAYAAELRTAAGLTAAAAPSASVSDRVRELIAHLDDAVPDRARPYLAAVRPGWWVLRGYLLVAAGLQVTGLNQFGHVEALVPRVWGNWGLGILLTVAAVIASVRLGAVPRRGTGRRVAVLALDVVALFGLLVLYAEASDPYPGSDGAVTCSGATNLYPYDASGRPLTDVRIVDQYGYPFDLVGLGCGTTDPNLDYSNAGTFPYPTLAPGADQYPTGPPTSLTPLPGATVSPAGTPSPTGAPSATGTPSPTGTPATR